MAYNNVQRQVVLFGGLTDGGVSSNETWVYPAQSVTEGYLIKDPGNNTAWSWQVMPSSGTSYVVSNPLTTGLLGSAEALTKRFVESINDKDCPGLQAAFVETGPLGSSFQITVGGTASFQLCVGPFNQTPTCCMPRDGNCTFNPGIVNIPMSGEDCNRNGVDDAIDTATGASNDGNGDGIPDECEGQGACCLPGGAGCADGTSTADCDAISGSHQGGGTTCATLPDSDGDGVVDCIDQCPGVDDAIFGPECEGRIPTVSEWGLVVLTLLLLTVGKVYFSRRRAAQV